MTIRRHKQVKCLWCELFFAQVDWLKWRVNWYCSEYCEKKASEAREKERIEAEAAAFDGAPLDLF